MSQQLVMHLPFRQEERIQGETVLSSEGEKCHRGNIAALLWASQPNGVGGQEDHGLC